MNKNATSGLQDSGTERFAESISNLQIAPPAEGTPTCQVCGDTIHEGDHITLYLFRPAGKATYTVGQCRCSTHNKNLANLFTLGIKEYIVDGRVGQCRDHATQQTWPVLLAPSIRLISALDTTTRRVVSNHKPTHPDGHRQEQTTDCESNKPDSIGGCQPSRSPHDRDDSIETATTISIGRNNDG